VRSTVFYSWQSDLPSSTNRGFIQEALEAACKSVRAIDEIAVQPVVDRDTANVPGAPDIAQTILQKIDAASLFVADVSIINRESAGRPTPNPNVLIELGYAIKSLGWSRVLLVVNDAFGGPETVPFDLRGRRVLTYSLTKDAEQKAPERRKLQALFELQLRAGLGTLLQDAEQTLIAQIRTTRLALLRAVDGQQDSIQITAGAAATVPTTIRAIVGALAKFSLDNWPQSTGAEAKEFLSLADAFTGACTSFVIAAQTFDACLARTVRHHNHANDTIAVNDPADRAFVIGRLLNFPDDEILPVLDMPKAAVANRFEAAYKKATTDETTASAIQPFLDARKKLLEAQGDLLRFCAH
jgi:hypothetical protein